MRARADAILAEIRGGGPVDRGRPVAVSVGAVVLSMVVAVLAGVAAGTGLLWSGGAAPGSVVSVHGEVVQLYGEGLYRHETVFKGAGNRGTDAVMLVVAVPLLVASALAYQRRSLRGALLLQGSLGWLLYVYATLAVGAAHNELFLVYAALFGASFYALVLTWRSIDVAALADLPVRAPRRSVIGLLVTAGTLTTVAWLGLLLEAALAGQPPALLGHATTTVTEALDLAILAPATFVTAVLLHRRQPVAYLIAVPLLVLNAGLAPTIVAQAISQLSAGLTFRPAEVAGPIVGFVVLGAAAVLLLVRILAVAASGAPPIRTPAEEYGSIGA